MNDIKSHEFIYFFLTI